MSDNSCFSRFAQKDFKITDTCRRQEFYYQDNVSIRREFQAILRDSLQLKPAEVVDGVEKAAVTLNYGNFLQATFDFIIIAFSIFLFIRLLARLNRKKEEVPASPAAPPAPSKEEVLLTEIRDLLKEQADKK